MAAEDGHEQLGWALVNAMASLLKVPTPLFWPNVSRLAVNGRDCFVHPGEGSCHPLPKQ